MITVQLHLYGKLRRYTGNLNPRKESFVMVQVEEGTSIREILDDIGISMDEVGSNIFLNGEYSSLDRPVNIDSRLGVFPDKWHFEKKEK